MRSRVLPALLAAGTLLLAAMPARTDATSTPQPDSTVLRDAAGRMSRQSAAQVIRWLGAQPAVASARIGRDGATLDIRFRDGQEMLVLPRAVTTRTVHPASLPRALRPLQRAHQSAGARAAVLEPFATELGLGPGAGSVEEQALRADGFSVDTGYDTAVTVSSMENLSRYNVVYMHTHSGTLAGGDGVLATGELANGDPAVQPLIADGSVVTVGVAGDNSHAYYALTSHFFAAHVSQFQHDSLLFLNGCKLLPATVFWQKLLARGVGVMVSWTDDATAQDDFLSAAGFFNLMNQGDSIARAISDLQAAGYGKSQYNGVTATLGYSGDGTITLSRAAQGQIALPTATPQPVPTSTGVSPATPVSTATSSPSATARPSAPPLRISAVRAAVNAGSRQQISVRTSPGVPVTFHVVFPNGTELSYTATADASGSVTFTFVQPKNAVTHGATKARVTVKAGVGTAVTTVTGTYSVRLGSIDLSIEPLHAVPGAAVKLWVHARPGSAVTVTVKSAAVSSRSLHLKTGSTGWGSTTYRVPRNLTAGAQITVAVSARVGSRTVKTSGVLTVR